MHPDKIGRYEIKKELGRGGMATVYLAYDPLFERLVALKILPRELMYDDQFRGRFQREAKIIAKLEHAAIVPVYDVGQDNEQPYFVMRCMTGGSLSDRMNDGPLSLEETAHIIQRVSAALAYAHSKGIIHRDLKPANILFDESDDAYISDYGIAKLTQSETNLTGSGIIGTPMYMSPEQAQGENIDSRSDIYSLGVIIYEMLSGARPYEANTPLGLVYKHISGPIPNILDVNPRLPAATAAVIEKALAKKREDRFVSAMDLAVAVGALSRGEIPDLDRTVPVGTRLYAPSRTNRPSAKAQDTPSKSRIWIGAGVGVLLLTIAALVWGGLRFANQSPQPTATRLAVTASIDPMVVIAPTAAPTLSAASPSPSPSPSPSLPAPVLPVGIGGADQIAFISANNIWVTNIDGSAPNQLTTDSKPKFDLQWLPDGKQLVYIQDKCALLLHATTRKITRITCFDQAKFFEGFSISPNEKQVAISVDHKLYIVPFDLTILAGIHDRNALAAIKGCLSYTGVSAKNSLWSSDGQKLALMFLLGREDGRLAETIRVLDVSHCQDADPLVLDDFPAKHFVPESYTSSLVLPSFSWNGNDLFLLNTLKRNEGYGPLYTYDFSNGQENKINPIKGVCCYRDARFSPDGHFIIFAFQDLTLGSGSQTLVYYIPLDKIGPNATFEPIQMPPSLFSNPREKPQFALHPVSVAP